MRVFWRVYFWWRVGCCFFVRIDVFFVIYLGGCVLFWWCGWVCCCSVLLNWFWCVVFSDWLICSECWGLFVLFCSWWGRCWSCCCGWRGLRRMSCFWFLFFFFWVVDWVGGWSFVVIFEMVFVRCSGRGWGSFYYGIVGEGLLWCGCLLWWERGIERRLWDECLCVVWIWCEFCKEGNWKVWLLYYMEFVCCGFVRSLMFFGLSVLWLLKLLLLFWGLGLWLWFLCLLVI